MCDVCAKPVKLICGACTKTQYCSDECRIVHRDNSHFFHCDGQKSTAEMPLAELLKKAMAYLQSPIKVDLPDLHQVALKKCDGNLVNARVVYEMAGAAIKNLKAIQRTNEVFSYILKHVGVQDKVIQEINKLKNEHLQLQQRIGLAFIKQSADMLNVPKYLEEANALMRTISWLIHTALNKAMPQESEDELDDQVAEFLVTVMEQEYKRDMLLK